jgi:hypothetical protein
VKALLALPRGVKIHSIALFITEDLGSRLTQAKDGTDTDSEFRRTPESSLLHTHLFEGNMMRRFVAIALSSTLMLQVAPLMAAPATRAGGLQAPIATGAINGVARNPAGNTLPNYTVQLRNLQTGQLSGVTTSNAAGSFSFAGLSPANYVVEVVNQAGAVVGSSAAIPVAAGATVTVSVSATAAAAIAGAAAGGVAAGGAAGGISTAVVITTIAAAAGIAGRCPPQRQPLSVA